MDRRGAVAEAIGTMALVGCGCGAAAVDAVHGGLGPVGVSLTFGLVVTAMVLATGHLSGAHLNPAVTLAFRARGRVDDATAALWITAQLVGALAGAGLVVWLLPGVDPGVTRPALDVGRALVLEGVLTAQLVFVIMAVATDARANGTLAAIAIGAAVTVGALAGGPLTGASMNPARSLGPALVAGELSHLWVYVVGPVVGGLVGAGAYAWVAHEPPVDRAG